MRDGDTRVRGADSTIDAGRDGFRPVPRDQPQPGASLGELIRFFLAKPSPLVLAAIFISAFTWRLTLGGWSWADLAIPAGVIALQPFTEWMIHVHLLHRKPTRLGRFTIDPVTARKHREHHRNPKDLRIVMVPYQALAPAVGSAILQAVLLEPRIAAMALSAEFGIFLWYEWVHYLIHAPYRPRTQWFRGLSRNHVLHHYKNEHYWFGVTVSFGDRVLRTRPDERSVDASPTVRTLGVDDAAAHVAAL